MTGTKKAPRQSRQLEKVVLHRRVEDLPVDYLVLAQHGAQARILVDLGAFSMTPEHTGILKVKALGRVLRTAHLDGLPYDKLRLQRALSDMLGRVHVVAALKMVVAIEGRAAAKALLQEEGGADSVHELDPSRFNDVIDACA